MAKTTIVLGRNPYGTTDKEVLVMKVAKADGSPLAVMFDYATHGTSLGTGNYTISGDVPGLAEQFVEKILGSRHCSGVHRGLGQYRSVVPRPAQDQRRARLDPRAGPAGDVPGRGDRHVYRASSRPIRPTRSRRTS